MEYDLYRIRHDLALSYAQEKLRYALKHGIPDKMYPDEDAYLDELAYLEQQFAIALSEFSNIGDDCNLTNALKIRL